MEYDYLVIGAGSAGCALAARLAERGKQVALLEAGGPDDAPEIPVPAAFPALFKSAVDWDYATEPQKGLNGRTDYWPRGKTLGGSSSMNAMIYQRGAPSDFDAWAALGNPGWSWADVLPLYKRSEHQERGASEYHGVGGPMNVADLRDPNPLTHVMLEASASLGLPLSDNFNGATQIGVGLYQVNQKNGTRWSAANGYLHPWLERGSGIEVVSNAHVTRLTFEGTRCTGAVFVRDGEEHTVRVRREVILTAGAINSPQFLMLSGVGPREQIGVPGYSGAP